MSDPLFDLSPEGSSWPEPGFLSPPPTCNVHGENPQGAHVHCGPRHRCARGRSEVRLASYGQAISLAWGTFGEAPTSLHQILEKCSDVIAQMHWVGTGAVCCADGVASQKQRLHGESTGNHLAARDRARQAREPPVARPARLLRAWAAARVGDARNKARQHAYDRAGPDPTPAGGVAKHLRRPLPAVPGGFEPCLVPVGRSQEALIPHIVLPASPAILHRLITILVSSLAHENMVTT